MRSSNRRSAFHGGTSSRKSARKLVPTTVNLNPRGRPPAAFRSASLILLPADRLFYFLRHGFILQIILFELPVNAFEGSEENSTVIITRNTMFVSLLFPFRHLTWFHFIPFILQGTEYINQYVRKKRVKGGK